MCYIKKKFFANIPAFKCVMAITENQKSSLNQLVRQYQLGLVKAQLAPMATSVRERMSQNTK